MVVINSDKETLMKIKRFVCMLDKTIEEKEMCKHHMRYKPHLGRIQNWERQYFKEVDSNKYCIVGLFEGHPKFNNHWGHTSLVVAEHEDEIETINSRYTLGTKRI